MSAPNSTLEMAQAVAAYLVEFTVTDAEGDISEVDVRVVTNTNMSLSEIAVFAEDNAEELLQESEGCEIEVKCVTLLDGITIVLSDAVEQTTH